MIYHILRRNCLAKHIIEGKIGEIKVTERQVRKRKLLMVDLKETRG